MSVRTTSNATPTSPDASKQVTGDSALREPTRGSEPNFHDQMAQSKTECSCTPGLPILACIAEVLGGAFQRAEGARTEGRFSGPRKGSLDRGLQPSAHTGAAAMKGAGKAGLGSPCPGARTCGRRRPLNFQKRIFSPAPVIIRVQWYSHRSWKRMELMPA